MNDQIIDTQAGTLGVDSGKRDFLKKTVVISAAGALMGLVPPGVRQGAWAAGSDGPPANAGSASASSPWPRASTDCAFA